ncbi:MAG: DoxX family membrane protein [Chthoniobacterales bacterium]|nr:DoxX family membrane protein [Chthoniobacterales bacterium]
MRMTFLGKYREAGLLILRLGLGCLFIYLSAPVVLGGAAKWAHFAVPLRHFGIRSHLDWWGLTAALLQLIGGVLMLLGLLFRIGVIFNLLWVILVTLAIWRPGLAAYTSLEMCVILASLLLIGPGKFSFDHA